MNMLRTLDRIQAEVFGALAATRGQSRAELGRIIDREITRRAWWDDNHLDERIEYQGAAMGAYLAIQQEQRLAA